MRHSLQAVAFLSTYLLVCQRFPPSFYLSAAFANYGFARRCAYLLLTAFAMRQHYYFAWSMCALSCLFSGFGFNGFYADGRPDYSPVKSFNVSPCEVSLRLLKLAALLMCFFSFPAA